jgi:hypothetical protein
MTTAANTNINNYTQKELNNKLIELIKNKTENLEEIKLFIDSGADIDYKDNLYKTPLTYACEYCSFDIIKLLIDSGANINAKNCSNNTPLMFACCKYNSSFEIITFLIENRSDNNIDLNKEHYYYNETILEIIGKDSEIHYLIETGILKMIYYQDRIKKLRPLMDSLEIEYICAPPNIFPNKPVLNKGGRIFHEGLKFCCK